MKPRLTPGLFFSSFFIYYCIGFDFYTYLYHPRLTGITRFLNGAELLPDQE